MVKLSTFLFKRLSESLLSNNSPFSQIPAHRNPIPVTICAAILDMELGSTSAEINVNIIEPPITKQWVLIPAALPFDSLSAQSENPPIVTIPCPMQNQARLYNSPGTIKPTDVMQHYI